MTNTTEFTVPAHIVAMRAEMRARTAAFQQAQQAQRAVEFASAIASPDFAYARARMICGSYTVFIYVNDTKSPTGVVLAGSSDDFQGAVAALDAAGRAFPFSPTESLQSSGARL